MFRARRLCVIAVTSITWCLTTMTSPSTVIPVPAGNYEIKCNPVEGSICAEVHSPNKPTIVIVGSLVSIDPIPVVSCNPPGDVQATDVWVWNSATVGFGFCNLSTPSCYNESALNCKVTVSTSTSQHTNYYSWRSAAGLP